jgi:hypothetical protein
MPKLSSSDVIGLVTASMLAMGALASPALAQADADQIRAQCLDEVGKAYPDISSTDQQTVRFNLYRSCMLRHGLTP